MSEYVLGGAADELTVRLYRDADFNVTLDISPDVAWPATPELRFIDNEPVVVWPSSSPIGPLAEWSIDKTVTSLRKHGETVELWVGDDCWAAGGVIRCGD